MIKLTNDIFIFENVLKDNLIYKLNKIRKDLEHNDRINLAEANGEVLYEFNQFWMNEIEPKIMNEYFSTYDIENGIGYNVSEETIESLREWLKTKWRDLYMLTYNTDMNSNGEKNVHWDFSFMTFVGCLSENFDGGVLFFPRQNVNYKLKMGDIIVFPGGITHPHYVTKVTEGQRNVLIGQSFNIVDGGLKPLI
jgi:hypothetical protein